MNFKDEESRELFFRYAIPCSETLAERGVISKKYQKMLMKNLSLNKKIPKNSENIFKVASSMCEKTTKRLGKKTVDKEVIRKYFLFGHDKVVDKRFKLFKDFDPMQCRLYSGKVVSLRNKATVQIVIGKRKYKTDFTRSLKVGDYVVVHRNFVVEKINEDLAKKLWKLKERYLISKKIKI